MGPGEATHGFELPYRFANGRYSLVSHLASGAMAEVYRTIRHDDDVVVATKVLHASLLDHADVVSRFKAEARAMQALDHPNIARVWEFGTFDHGQGFMVMEWLEGRDLGTIVDHEGPLPVPRALRMGASLLDALGHAHAKGIVHRDFKSENVVCVAQGDEERVKVVDFGLAKIVDESLRTETMIPTRRGAVFGTPSAMSPEQGRGLVVDHRTDLYAFGILLYELVTGMLPFPARTPLEAIRHHLMTPPIPLAERRPGARFPEGLWPFLAKCLAKTPLARFQSAEEARLALLAVASSAS